MKILAFETSAKAASVALLEEGKLLGSVYQNTGLTHSQTLMVMAQDLPDGSYRPSRLARKVSGRCGHRPLRVR